LIGPLTKAGLEALREIDTPTVCNVLEMVAPERRGYGYTVQHLHCIFPDMKPIVGYAKTATMRAKQPSRFGGAEASDIRNAYFDYLDRGATLKKSASFRISMTGRATAPSGARSSVRFTGCSTAKA
jgi:hypothetical protein